MQRGCYRLVAAICLLTALGSASCFSNTRLPKILQTPVGATAESSALAITGHDALNAIFVGGFLAEPEFFIDPGFQTAHVGRISTLD